MQYFPDGKMYMGFVVLCFFVYGSYSLIGSYYLITNIFSVASPALIAPVEVK